MGPNQCSHQTAEETNKYQNDAHETVFGGIEYLYDVSMNPNFAVRSSHMCNNFPCPFGVRKTGNQKIFIDQKWEKL